MGRFAESKFAIRKFRTGVADLDTDANIEVAHRDVGVRGVENSRSAEELPLTGALQAGVHLWE